MFPWRPPGQGRNGRAAMADRITWYDILGILPSASPETVRRAYQDKARQLERAQTAGVPPQVADAAARGRVALDGAWLILGNRSVRERYDEEIGVVQRGGGLVRPEPAPLRPGWDPADEGT
jgi:curved DNA-binding protein CbpA